MRLMKAELNGGLGSGKRVCHFLQNVVGTLVKNCNTRETTHERATKYRLVTFSVLAHRKNDHLQIPLYQSEESTSTGVEMSLRL